VLFQRVITALILIPLVVAGVLYLPTLYLALLLMLVVILGGLEWTRLAGLESTPAKLMYSLILVSFMAGLASIFHLYPLSVFAFSLLFTLFWILIAFKLIRLKSLSTHPSAGFGKSVMGVLVLVPAWSSLWLIHALYQDGPYLLLFLMVLIWTADSGAYFAGSRWGRVKLAPLISPGKSREGVYGGLAGAALCGVLLYFLRPETGALPLLILLSVVVALFSVVGDLFESLMKRQAGIKDSGNLLPGHGGVLDRIDSLTAASPVFLFGLLLLELTK